MKLLCNEEKLVCNKSDLLNIKKDYLVYVNHITKIMLWNFRGVFLVVVQVVNTNIHGFV